MLKTIEVMASSGILSCRIFGYNVTDRVSVDYSRQVATWNILLYLWAEDTSKNTVSRTENEIEDASISFDLIPFLCRRVATSDDRCLRSVIKLKAVAESPSSANSFALSQSRWLDFLDCFVPTKCRALSEETSCYLFAPRGIARYFPADPTK